MRKLPGKLTWVITFFILLFLLSYASYGTAVAVTFTDSGQLLGYQPINVEMDIGDIDNDGDYDLLLASQGSSGAIEVYINNGSGSFTKLNQQFPQAQSSSGGTFEDITFGVIYADVNNDGWLDIVTADAWDGINIYLNDRTGHFLTSQLGLGTEGIEVKGVDLGDMDNDGDLDMIFGGHQYNTDNEVWRNDGSGIFTDTGQRHYSEAIWHLAFGDIDNDGDLDYVFTSRYTEPNTTSEVYFNDGEGNFNNSNQDFLPIGNSFGIVLRDIDNDGDLDFIEPNDASANPLAAPRIRIYKNDGFGTFSDSGQNLGGSVVKDVDLGDIDNDGDYDVVMANWLVENSLLINDGSGVFSQVGSDLLLPHGTHAIKLGDLDNDGDLDLVIGNLLDKTYGVYFSDQAGLVANSIPSPPTLLQSEYSEGKIIFTWNNGADFETKQNTLTYNLRIGTASNPNSIVTGVIRSGPGNMGHAFKKIINSLPEGNYIWSVQTVDGGYSRSSWATEQKFRIIFFSDLAENHWAYYYITNLSLKDMVSGYPDRTFRPANNITRAEFAKVVVMALSASLPTSWQDYFPDVSSSHWAWKYIEKAKELGILSGYPDGTFKPENKITRAEIAKMVVNAAGFATNISGNRFPDVSTTHWAYNFIMTARNAGIVNGYPDGTFRPEGVATRAEAAKMIFGILR